MKSNKIQVIFKDEANFSNNLNELIINLLVDSMKNKRSYEYTPTFNSGGNIKENDRKRE